MPLPRIVLFTLTFYYSGLTAFAAAEATNQVTEFTLERKASAPAIGRGLFGAQYNFFSGPVKKRITDPALIQSWRDMPVKVLRYPGGTWGDHYIWDNPKGSYFRNGDEHSVISPEEFIANCRAVGAEPIFQVNANIRGSTHKDLINPTKIEDIRIGAERAARWVREVNQRKGWKVKYWEIGNEVWIWLKAEEYAVYVVEYATAMRAVDPTIKIIACGLAKDTRAFNPDKWLKFPDDPAWTPRTANQNTVEGWNRALQEKAAGYFDSIAPHIYLDSPDAKMTARERFDWTNSRIWEGRELKQQVVWAQKMGAKIALTEWAANFRHSVPVLRQAKKVADTDTYYYYSLGNGLNNALFFGKIVEAAGTVELAVLHALDDFQTLWYWPKNEMAKDVPLLHPTYLAMQLWGRHLGTKPLAINSGAAPTLTYSGQEYPALYTYATEDDTHIYLVAINLDADNGHDLKLKNTSGPASATATWLKGPRIGSGNFAAWNGAAAPEVALSVETVPSKDGGWTLSLPTYSMVGLKIDKPQ